MEIFRDPIWTFVACIIGTLGAFIPLLVTVIARTKEVSCEVISNSKLISLSDDMKNRINISINGNPIESASLIVLKFSNGGFSAIKKQDFAESIQIFFPPTSQVLDANIVEPNPENLNPQITFNANCITIAPLLLNGGDNFMMKIIAKGDTPPITIKDRITGIKKIKLIGNGNNRFNNLGIALKLGLLSCGGWANALMLSLLVFSLFIVTTDKTNDILPIIFTLFSLGGLVLVFGVFLITYWIAYNDFKRK